MRAGTWRGTGAFVEDVGAEKRIPCGNGDKRAKAKTEADSLREWQQKGAGVATEMGGVQAAEWDWVGGCGLVGGLGCCSSGGLICGLGGGVAAHAEEAEAAEGVGREDAKGHGADGGAEEHEDVDGVLHGGELLLDRVRLGGNGGGPERGF